ECLKFMIESAIMYKQKNFLLMENGQKYYNYAQQ
ncbi:unnamed protein product, partial [Heterotrigona itama]